MRRDGWIVIVVRKDGFSGPERERWLSELKAALAERSRHPGSGSMPGARTTRRTGVRADAAEATNAGGSGNHLW